MAMVDGQIILNGRPVPQDMEPPVRLPAANDNVCDQSGFEHPCLDDFAPYLVTLENGSQVYEPPTFRETLPNGASYLIIDHMQQRLDDMEPVITCPMATYS